MLIYVQEWIVSRLRRHCVIVSLARLPSPFQFRFRPLSHSTNKSMFHSASEFRYGPDVLHTVFLARALVYGAANGGGRISWTNTRGK